MTMVCCARSCFGRASTRRGGRRKEATHTWGYQPANMRGLQVTNRFATTASRDCFRTYGAKALRIKRVTKIS